MTSPKFIASNYVRVLLPTGILLFILLGGASWIWHSSSEEPNGAEPENLQVLPQPDNILPASPQAERISQPNLQPLRDSFLIRVIGENGSGLGGATLEISQGNLPSIRIVSDSQGNVSTLAFDGGGWILVEAPGYLHSYHHVNSFTGSLDLILGTGRSVRGSLTNHGGEMDWDDVTLTLLSQAKQPRGVPRRLTTKLGANRMTVAVGPDGRFQVLGIPEEWAGSILLPAPLLACGENDPNRITNNGKGINNLQPGENLNIYVHSMPILRGKIVSDNEKPISEQSLWIQLSFASAKQEFLATSTDSSGNFHTPFRPSSAGKSFEEMYKNDYLLGPIEANIQAFQSANHGEDDISLNLFGREDRWDLGTIQLKNQPLLEIQVLDNKEVPISGAVATNRNVSQPTGSQGFTSLILGDLNGKITVGAQGYEAIAIEIPSQINEVLPVTLLPGATLTIKVETGDSSLVGAELSIRASGMLFEKNSSSALQATFESAPKHGTADRDGNETKYWLLKPEQRSITLSGIATGVELEAKIVGIFRTPISSSGVFILDRGEQKVIDLTVQSAPVTFSGVVEDEAGNPIANAVLYGKTEFGGFFNRKTTDDGRFQVDGLGASEIFLRVSSEGFAMLADRHFPIDPTGRDIRITLQRGRALDIFVNDDSGIPIENLVMFYGYNHGGTFAKEIGQGRYLLDPAPPGAFALSWMAGGLTGDFLVPGGGNAFNATLPQMGGLNISFLRDGNYINMAFSYELEPVGNVPAGFDGNGWVGLREGQSSVIERIPNQAPGKFRLWTWPQRFGRQLPGSVKIDHGIIEVLPGELLELEISVD